MIYKLLGQSDLYYNSDPLCRLVEEVNETTVLVDGQEARVLILWFSVFIHFIGLGEETEFESRTTSVCATD